MKNIKERIAKLKALQNDKAASPGEVANCAALIQDLLFQYNLSEVDIETTDHVEEAYDKEQIVIGVSSPGSKDWKVRLLSVIARNNFCRVLDYQNTEVAYLVGQESNREVVKNLYEYLMKELTRLQKSAFKVAPERGYCKPYIWKKSFLAGAVSTIDKRLKEQKTSSIAKADLANAGSGTALVVKADNSLSLAVKDLFPNVRQTRSRMSEMYGSAFAHGVQAGNNVELNKSLTPKQIALNS